MSNFLFSVNATLPVFLVILLGYFLKRIGMLGPEFVKQANAFNFKVTLPVLLFQELVNNDVVSSLDIPFMALCFAVTLVSIIAIWVIARLVIKDTSIIGAFVQGSYRSSVAVLSVAFLESMYGGAAMAPQMIIAVVPLYNIFAVVVMTFEPGLSGDWAGQGKDKIRTALVNVVKNPIIIGIVLGVIGSVIHLRLPAIGEKTVSYVASLATPLALITLGAGFEGRKALAKIPPTIWASVIKLVLLPGIFLPVFVWMGFRQDALLTALVMLSSPTTPSCYIMAETMGHDGVLTASIVVATTLLASVTLTGWIFLFHSLGMV